MSKYTTEVRYICETYAGLTVSSGYNNLNEIIEKARDKVFDFDFPIYDESYRSVLETKILKHYYTREIGFETVGLWKHFLDMRLNEIMPYYNQLYKSTLYDFNPLYDVDLTTTSNRKVNHDENTTADNTRTDNLKSVTESDATRTDNLTNSTISGNTNKYSDTPQGGLTGIENDEYLTNATIDSGNSESKDTGTVKNTGTDTTTNTGTQNDKGSGSRKYDDTDEYLEHVTGKTASGNYSEMLLKYRETFINIDMQIINDLSDLFFNLW